VLGMFFREGHPYPLEQNRIAHLESLGPRGSTWRHFSDFASDAH
jgi:hypothetical protein